MSLLNNLSLGQRLRRERERLNWSQERLAEAVGTTARSINRWEQDKVIPHPHYRNLLCNVFNVPADALFGSSAAPHPDATRDALAPFSLPPAPRQLIGRDALFAQLKASVCSTQRVALTALHGLPGVGKTALALTLAHDAQVQAHFRDGVLWAGLGPAPHLIGLPASWGNLLDIPQSRMEQLHSVEAWAWALRSAIGKRRLLLVIDDAWKIEDALTFKVGGPACAYVLTTRFREIASHFAETGTMTVPELPPDDALALLASLAPEASVAEPEATYQLALAAGGLPLALTLVGKYLHRESHSGQPRRLRTAIEHLGAAQERLHLSQPQAALERPPHLPGDAPLSLHAATAVSDQHLRERSQVALRALAVFSAKPDTFSEEAALAVMGNDAEALDQLGDAGLLESAGPGRYSLHQVIADYARLTGGGVMLAAEARLVAYMAEYIQTHTRDYAALERERASMLAALHLAFERGMSSTFVRILTACTAFLDSRGMYDTAEFYLERAKQVAQSQDGLAALAGIVLWCGRIAVRRGAYAQAEAAWQEGLSLAQQTGHRDRSSLFLANLGAVAYERGDYAAAETWLQEGVMLARQIGHRERLCSLLGNLGGVAYEQGRDAQAQEYLIEGLALARRMGQPERMSALLLYLGKAAVARGEDALAETYLQEGGALADQLGKARLRCAICCVRGELLLKRHEREAAASAFDEALAHVPPESRELLAQVRFGQARLAAAEGKLDVARAWGEESLLHYQAIHHRAARRVHAFLHDLP